MSIEILGFFLKRKGLIMFNGVEYIRNVCKEKGIPISSLEKKCGFANGYLNPKKLNKLPYDRALLIADALNISVDYLMTGEEKNSGTGYYLNDETAKLAQEMFEDEDMRSLFDMKRNMPPERFKAHMDFMKNLYNQEKGNNI